MGSHELTKAAGNRSGGLFSLLRRVPNCKRIKRLAKRRGDVVVLPLIVFSYADNTSSIPPSIGSAFTNESKHYIQGEHQNSA